jgi:hypothetical protein
MTGDVSTSYYSQTNRMALGISPISLTSMGLCTLSECNIPNYDMTGTSFYHAQFNLKAPFGSAVFGSTIAPSFGAGGPSPSGGYFLAGFGGGMGGESSGSGSSAGPLGGSGGIYGSTRNYPGYGGGSGGKLGANETNASGGAAVVIFIY